MKTCSCGSGLSRRAQHDGHGIFLTFTCDACHKRRMSEFRSDIRERYDTDETIEAEPYYGSDTGCF